MKKRIVKLLGIIIILLIMNLMVFAEVKKTGKPNVLFIAVDDLRPQLGCYGHSETLSPNIDKLAKDGVVFTNAYCSVPVCGASRASLLKGARGTRDRFNSFKSRGDVDMPEADSIPMTFKKGGYDTRSIGKIYHHYSKDDLNAWTNKPWSPRGSAWTAYVTDEAKKIWADAKKEGRRAGPAYECADVPDNGYPDGKIADKAIEDLKILKKDGKPFFLGVGFHKPHLPFLAPKKYWDMYKPEDIKLAKNAFRSKNAPNRAFHQFNELRMFEGIPRKGPISDEMAKKLIHAYYACVSYIDAQVGRVIGELDKLGLRDDTIIVLWGDHGWQLGEHALWCKHCNFNTSLNAPLIISAPGMKKDVVSNALVEFVDIYPSLCDLAGLSKPKHLEGDSFVPLLENPKLPWKDAVFSRYNSGESIRTKRYLYTEWKTPDGKIHARMLYDHQKDPDENVNISELPENAELVKSLSEKLKKGWKSFRKSETKKN